MSNTNAETIDTNNTTILNINTTNITKLDSTNYRMWSLQVRSLFDGYDLASHLDGTTSSPSETVVVNGVTQPNPAFVLWKRHDKLLFSGLLGTFSPTVQPLVSTVKITADIWNILASTYAKPCRGHIKQLKIHIQQYVKGTKTIDEYFQGLTTKFDQLALLVKPVEHEDQLDSIYQGLSDDNKPIVDQLDSRDNTPTLTEVHEKLLNHEAKLLTVTAALPTLPASAKYANNRPKQSQGRNHHRSNSSWTPSSQQGHHSKSS